MSPDQYAREVYRTRPDIVVYRPAGELVQGENQHFLVVVTPKGRLLATWTQATRENHPDQHVVVSTSEDAHTWTEPVRLDGAGPNDKPGTGLASWAFPVVAPRLGRIYIFYNKNIGVQDTREDTTGVLRGRFSADEGKTWSEPFDLPIEPCALSPEEPGIPQSWIVFQPPIVAGDGVPIVGFTHWGSARRFGERDLFKLDSELRFLRFENILTETEPTRLVVSAWPKSPHGLRVMRADRPEVSVAQEPSVVLLPDGRLFCVCRTLNGYIAWSQSRDHGRTWSDPLPLRYSDRGEIVRQPIAPCPIYRTGKDRYVLIFHNNDGTANGGKGPSDYTRNRYPAYTSVGTFDPRGEQPIRFDAPKHLMTSDGVILGPSRRTEVATYTSYTRFRGRGILWYPDRKHFLLGRYLD